MRQGYHLGRGDQLRPDLPPLPATWRAALAAHRLAEVAGPKRTALGEGWFVTTRNTWYSGDEPVAEMDWRVLKFRPPRAAQAGPATRGKPRARRCSPTQEDDAAEHPDATAGTRPTPRSSGPAPGNGELRIQRCGECGALRHPPGPACLSCGGTRQAGYAVAAGTGTVYSYVVHRHPPVPGKQLPIVIALVELTEGVRMMGELHRRPSPTRSHIGMPVRASFTRIDDDLVLPGWRPDERGRARSAAGAGHQRHAHRRGRPPRSRPAISTRCTTTTTMAVRQRQQGHLPQHPHHDRPGAAVTSPTGQARRRSCAQSRSGSACRVTPATR